MRFGSSSLAVSGLVIGAATVIGGIGGTMLGSKVAEHYKHKVKSSFFLVPALFYFAGAGVLILAVNIPSPLWLNCLFIIVAEIFFWAYIGPISALSINVVPPRLRARSAGLQIFLQHILGDVIASPIIGAISDATGSLQYALQITWIAALVCGVFWLLGYLLLPPLHIDGVSTLEEELLSAVELGSGATPASATASNKNINKVTYAQLFCGQDVLMLNEQGEIVPRDGNTPPPN